MRFAFTVLLGALFATPALAGDASDEKLFGRDPGNGPAYACFSRAFDAPWLQAHPEQNVARLTVFVARKSGDDTVWHSGNMELHFRDSAATYHVTADCSGQDGVLGCGVDCDGGGYKMTVMSNSELGIEVDDYLRYYDIFDTSVDARTSGFRAGDKNLVVARSDLRDCLSLIADEDIKAKIAGGFLTQ